MSKTIRKEYPNPGFKREKWMSLNGEWDFSFKKDLFDQKIQVPFCYQSNFSGIEYDEHQENMWYKRSFKLDKSQANSKSILLIFAGVDYYCKVYVNNILIGDHSGGYERFSYNIAGYVKEGTNTITLYVNDDKRTDKPRGKQYWKNNPDRCWYIPCSGIWKSVWLEFTGESYIGELCIQPDISNSNINVRGEIFCENKNKKNSEVSEYKYNLNIELYYEDNLQKRICVSLAEENINETISILQCDKIDEVHYWDPDNPNLYTAKFTLCDYDGNPIDFVTTYFGMREISIKDNQILFNKKPLFQRLVLDQGYWGNSNLCAPSEEAIIKDLELIKNLGFNGVRMHQKIEEPLFYYHADRLGLLVWLEMPSPYDFNPREVSNFTNEWLNIVKQHFNHPSIIAYVPFNESWGIRNVYSIQEQQNFANGIYSLTKAIDPTRIISTNDGWEFVNNTDIYGIHSYFSNADEFSKDFYDIEVAIKSGMKNRPLLSKGVEYKNKPVFISEFGGTAFSQDSTGENWGYNENASGKDEFLDIISTQVRTILSIPNVAGYCYTQLTDVYQEVNGLLDSDRNPKADMNMLCEIFSKVF